MSKKQVKTKKNVFGLVSKIGSLIKKGNSASNIDSVETARSSGTSGSETPRKNFNIQISDDNQEIFAVGDDEEEEEEDEEENEKEIEDKKEKKEKENKDNINENISSDVKDKKNDKEIKNENINLDVKKEAKENENENKNKVISAKEEEEEKQKQKDINNNLNDNNNINNVKNVKNEEKVVKDNANINDKEVKNNNENGSNSKIIEENNKKDNIANKNEIKEENNINNDNNKINEEEKIENNIKENTLNEHFETCHLCLKKGNDFNSDEIYCIPIIRNKKKKSVLQKFGLFKKPKYDLVNYKIFFDECFIYLSKDIIIDKKNTNKRRINNVLKIKNIINFNTKKEQNNYFVTIDIYNKNGVLKNKEFFVEEKYFEYFNKEINKSLELYGGLYMKSKNL